MNKEQEEADLNDINKSLMKANMSIENYAEEVSNRVSIEKQEKEIQEQQEKNEISKVMEKHKKDVAKYKEEYIQYEKGVNNKSNIVTYKNKQYIMEGGNIYLLFKDGEKLSLYDTNRVVADNTFTNDDLIIVDGNFVFLDSVNEVKFVDMKTKEVTKRLKSTHTIESLYSIHNGLIYYDGTNIRKLDMISDVYSKEKYYKQEDTIIAKVFGNLLFNDGNLLFTGDIENVSLFEDTDDGDIKKISNSNVLRELMKNNPNEIKLTETPVSDRTLGTTNLILLSLKEGKFKFIKEKFPYILKDLKIANEQDEIELVFNKEIELKGEEGFPFSLTNEVSYYVPTELKEEKLFNFNFESFELKELK